LINQLVRYAPVLRMLRAETGTLLEVGSGSDGICQYLGRATIGLEIRFPAPPHPLLRAACGTATHLPFAERSIDVVLIMDTMEHIPSPLRDRALAEAMRVARRRIIVGGPMGPHARGADVKLAAYYTARGIEVPDWLDEHLHQLAPDVADIVTPLRAAGFTVHARGNENLPMHLGLMKLETRRFPSRVLGRIRRHAAAPAAAVARTVSMGPYYSWLVDATRT
jgi:hypothetical protein